MCPIFWFTIFVSVTLFLVNPVLADQPPVFEVPFHALVQNH